MTAAVGSTVVALFGDDSTQVQVGAQVAEMAAGLCVLAPLPECGARSGKGRWRCIRSPHPATPWHVYGKDTGRG